MREITGHIKNYAWGIKGNTSLVADLAKSGKHINNIDHELSYAELWLGTHKSGMSHYFGTDDEISTELFYLLKVLSIGKTLSIQIHPNKNLAEKLHRQKKHIYPDSNDKPEMAVCLTNCEVLCGLQSFSKMMENSKQFPEVILEKIFNTPINVVETIVERLMDKEDKTQVEELILRLYQEHGIDSGILAPIIMNYICLKPGEALVVYPDTPHAYMSGQMIECMKCSDNVIRLGLTPKIKDLETLDKLIMQNEYAILSEREVYDPININFRLKKFDVLEKREIIVKKRSILLIIEGEGTINKENVHRGQACYFDEDMLIFALGKLKIIIAEDKFI